MAVEPGTTETPSQDMEAHVRDYSGFVRVLTISAAVCFAIAIIVMMLIS